MNKKNKLMKALVGLELSNKAKQEFCDIILDKSNNESGGEGAGESTMEYLDVSGVDFVNGGNKEGSLLMVSFMVKCNHTILGDNTIVPIGQLYVAGTSKITSVHALAFDFSVRYIVNTGTTNVSLKEALIQTGWTEEELAAIPRITKEQFYSLNIENNAPMAQSIFLQTDLSSARIFKIEESDKPIECNGEAYLEDNIYGTNRGVVLPCSENMEYIRIEANFDFGTVNILDEASSNPYAQVTVANAYKEGDKYVAEVNIMYDTEYYIESVGATYTIKQL